MLLIAYLINYSCNLAVIKLTLYEDKICLLC